MQGKGGRGKKGLGHGGRTGFGKKASGLIPLRQEAGRETRGQIRDQVAGRGHRKLAEFLSGGFCLPK